MDTALARLNDANQDRAIESAATVLHQVTCDGAVLSPADVSVVAEVRVGRTGAYLRRGLPCSPHVLTRCVLCCAAPWQACFQGEHAGRLLRALGYEILWACPSSGGGAGGDAAWQALEAAALSDLQSLGYRDVLVAACRTLASLPGPRVLEFVHTDEIERKIGALLAKERDAIVRAAGVRFFGQVGAVWSSVMPHLRAG